MCKFCKNAPINFVIIIFAKIWECTVLNGKVTKWRKILSRDGTLASWYMHAKHYALCNADFALRIY